MTMSRLTYILGFFCEFFLSTDLYWLYKLDIFWLKITFKSSPLKPLNQIKGNLAGMVLGWSPFNCVRQPCPPFKMAAVTEHRNFFRCQFPLYYKSKWTFNCNYMAMSSLTYILSFSVRFFSASLFHLGILWDKNHIKIFCSEIWVEMIFGWPTFKIMCNTPIFYQISEQKILM